MRGRPPTLEPESAQVRPSTSGNMDFSVFGSVSMALETAGAQASVLIKRVRRLQWPAQAQVSAGPTRVQLSSQLPLFLAVRPCVAAPPMVQDASHFESKVLAAPPGAMAREPAAQRGRQQFRATCKGSVWEQRTVELAAAPAAQLPGCGCRRHAGARAHRQPAAAHAAPGGRRKHQPKGAAPSSSIIVMI
jgi:hypothetical protein